MPFRMVPSRIWRLGDGVAGQRRRRLLETPFEEIVRRVVDEARLTSMSSERIKRIIGARRVLVKLTLSREVVDLFHNGAGGYRAQYYLGTTQGEKANRYAINCLLPRIRELCAARPKRGCEPDSVDASMRDPDAKVWIHQGTWLRDRGLADRNLAVQRWIDNSQTMELKNKRISIWAELTPSNETKLDIKGGCVDSEGRSLGIKLKLCRSDEISELGFT